MNGIEADSLVGVEFPENSSRGQPWDSLAEPELVNEHRLGLAHRLQHFSRPNDYAVTQIRATPLGQRM